MSNASKTRKKRSPLTPLFVFLAILVVLALIFTILCCIPLKSLGLSDTVVLNGKTIADLKLDDVSVSRLWPIAKSLFTDNSRLVDYPHDASDVASTNSKFAASSANQLGTVQYSTLIYKNATFATGSALTLTDKQLAVVLDKAVKQAPDDLMLSTSADVLEYLGSRSLKDVLDCLETFNVTVEQVKMGSKSNSPTFEVLISIDISQYVKDVDLSILGTLQSRVYVTLTYALGATQTGNLQLKDGELSVNGKNAAMSQKVLDGLLIALNDDANGAPQTSQTFIDGIAAFAQVVFEHVGDVGTSIFNKGASGLDATNKTITFITHTSLLDLLP